MTETGRVVTANLPKDLVSRMDEAARRMDRSKSWIVRQAGTGLRKAQTGYVRNYALGVAGGAVLVLGWFIFVLSRGL